jgi:hypothetical protein
VDSFRVYLEQYRYDEDGVNSEFVIVRNVSRADVDEILFSLYLIMMPIRRSFSKRGQEAKRGPKVIWNMN